MVSHNHIRVTVTLDPSIRPKGLQRRSAFLKERGRVKVLVLVVSASVCRLGA
jgi:hypothetical protein